MRPHPQIAPYIRRTSRDRAELVVQMAPENGDPVPALVIPLDARAGTRMLAELLDVFRSAWIEASPACDRAGWISCDTPREKDGKSHERSA
ncbi:hypothetical protein ACFSKM_07690 [Ancylobacter dichloromethanicus]